MEHRDDSVKGAKYLRGKSPLELVWKKAVASKSIAAKVEYRLKRLQKSKKEKIVLGENSHEILKEENIAC
jgi:putative endonuclease